MTPQPQILEVLLAIVKVFKERGGVNAKVYYRFDINQ
jgi:hypothetical protein